MTKKRVVVFIEVILLIIAAAVFIKIAWPRYSLFIRKARFSNTPKEWFDLYWKSKDLRDQGKTDEALKLLQEAVTYEGIDGKVYLMLAVVYMDKHEYEQAAKYYKLALKQGMGNPVNKFITLNNLGELYHDRYSDYEKAIKYFKKALAIRPGKGEPFGDAVDPVTGLIEAYAHNNQYDLAKELLEKEQCDTRYCKWLKKAPRQSSYRSLKGVNVQTKIYYDSEGTVKREFQMKGKEGYHGFVRNYNDKGMLINDNHYIDDKDDGTQRTYNDKGELTYEFVYRNGKFLDEEGIPFSGTKEFAEDPAGFITKSVFVDGLLHGASQVYAEDGRLYAEMNFEEGEAGKMKAYYEDGKLWRESDMRIKDGILYREYYENGQISKEMEVKDGEMVSIKNYDEEGNYSGDSMNPTVESVTIIRYGFIEDIEKRKKEQEKVKSDVPVCPIFTTPVLDRETDVVPARLNVHFGINFRIEGTPEDGYTTIIARFTHPPLTNPKTGETVTVEDNEQMVMFKRPSHVGWIFAYPWEVVPGKWKIEILHEDRVLVEKEFTVE